MKEKELKEMKEMKEKELREIQAREAKLTSTNSEKRPYRVSEGNDELNNKRRKEDFPNAGSRDDVTGNNRLRNISKERESEKSEHSASSERNIKSEQVKTGRDDPHQGPAFDLRGLLTNKQMIKQIRHSVEQNQRIAGKGGDDSNDEAKQWLVEPQFREDMYAFDPNDPVANPDWSSDLQVVFFAEYLMLNV